MKSIFVNKMDEMVLQKKFKMEYLGYFASVL
jgi:hypothetical protein